MFEGRITLSARINLNPYLVYEFIFTDKLRYILHSNNFTYPLMATPTPERFHQVRARNLAWEQREDMVYQPKG